MPSSGTSRVIHSYLVVALFSHLPEVVTSTSSAFSFIRPNVVPPNAKECFFVLKTLYANTGIV